MLGKVVYVHLRDTGKMPVSLMIRKIVCFRQ